MMIDVQEYKRIYDYKHPDQESFQGGVESLVKELAESAAFRRLSGIRFLGAIDYALIKQPNGYSANTRYTRYAHSLGVAALSNYFCNLIDAPIKHRRLIVASALLHDLGHSPLSHSIEPVFKNLFGLDHHMMTREIILGKARIDRSIPEILNRNGIDADEVLQVLDGETLSQGDFFAGPINFDTIEGILRSLRYARPRRYSTHPHSVVKSSTMRLSSRDKSIVDDFWTKKDNVYLSLINSKAGIISDEAARIVMYDNHHLLRDDDFLLNEADLFRKIPELRTSISSERACAKLVASRTAEIRFVRRRFHINSQADFFSRNDCERYLQSKIDVKLRLQPISDESFGGTSIDWEEIYSSDP